MRKRMRAAYRFAKNVRQVCASHRTNASAILDITEMIAPAVSENQQSLSNVPSFLFTKYLTLRFANVFLIDIY